MIAVVIIVAVVVFFLKISKSREIPPESQPATVPLQTIYTSPSPPSGPYNTYSQSVPQDSQIPQPVQVPQIPQSVQVPQAP